MIAQRVLIYLGHPAHFHLFKTLIKGLQDGSEVLVVIKKKDILERLLQSEGLSYANILEEGKKGGKLALIWSLLKRDVRMWRKANKFKPDIMLGTSAEIAHIGSLMRIPSYIFEEDDWDVIPSFARATYPFATKILAPYCCRMGKWDNKTKRYNSYHELAYLHPDHFEPSREVIKEFHNTDESYFILRFVDLSAHHDSGIQGITDAKAEELIGILEKHGKVYISSERKLKGNLDQYRIQIDPLNIHHALYYAKLFIGDSQTMAAESMVLGTPSIRYNDFVGRISYLEELENYYQLGFGFKTQNYDYLLERVRKLLKKNDLEEEWNLRRENMLEEKINFASYLANFIENYES